MRKLDFYEFAGIIIPGTVLLFGAAICSPPIRQAVFEQDLSVGQTAISLIVAYGLGHLVAAFGNLLEKVWWRLWGGMPSDWLRTGKHNIVAAGQISMVDAALRTKLGLEFAESFRTLSADDWYGVVRQVYAKLAAGGAAQRIDIFNGNYGLNRGLAAALLVILIIVVIVHGFVPWRAELLLVLGAVVAVCRMHRFGVHYARELLVQFLALEDKGGDAPTESRG